MSLGALEQVPENPLAEGLERSPVHPTSLVIFGATGDLARRKLLPAIYNLAHDGSLPERFRLIGVSRGGAVRPGLPRDGGRGDRAGSRAARPTERVLDGCSRTPRYVAGSFDDPGSTGSSRGRWTATTATPAASSTGCSTCRPRRRSSPSSSSSWPRHGLNRHDGGRGAGGHREAVRHAPREARALNARCCRCFDGAQVFRIDHYLGKETVQNLLVLRFANSIFEPLWNRNYIDHVQITAAEDIGVERRGPATTTQTGALRDMVQNHMLQLLCLLAMEPPVGFGADEVRNEKVKVLRAIDAAAARRGRRASRCGRSTGRACVGGEPVPGYREEQGVPPDSTTETFAALRLQVDSWRWAGVPFYLRTGKRLARRRDRDRGHAEAGAAPRCSATGGSLGVQAEPARADASSPTRACRCCWSAKIPGPRMILRPVKMEFLYGATFLSQSPEAYERLLLDAMRGDATLFTRDDEVEGQWRICDPIVRAWEQTPGPLPQYPAGSRGRAEADRVLLPGHAWRAL